MTELGLRWVKYSARGSWHILDEREPHGPERHAHCGLPVTPRPVHAFPPPDEKTCESCYRLRERRAG